MVKPTIQQSLFDSLLIIQKIEEWRTILERAQVNPSLRRGQLKDIQKKIEKMSDIIHKVHGNALWSDEVISKAYYGFMDELEQLRLYFEASSCEIHLFIEDERVRLFLEGLPFDHEYSLKDKAIYVTQNTRLHELAYEFTARWSGLPEDRVKKKVKKIYK